MSERIEGETIYATTQQPTSWETVEEAYTFDSALELMGDKSWVGLLITEVRSLRQQLQEKVEICHTKLAAAQADNARLREALKCSLYWMPEYVRVGGENGYTRPNGTAILKDRKKVVEALAIPHDDTALREMLLEVAKKSKNNPHWFDVVDEELK